MDGKELVQRFFQALARGSMEEAEGLFAEDAVLVGPGGERVRGRRAIARSFFEGAGRRFSDLDVREEGERVLATFHVVPTGTGWMGPLPLRAEFCVEGERITFLDFAVGGLRRT